MSMQITQANFKTEVLESPIPVIVDFWAPWCRPCQMLGPIIEEVAQDKAGLVKVGKVNVDECEDLSIRYGISSIPTVMVFRGGVAVKKVVGLMRKEDLIRNLGL